MTSMTSTTTIWQAVRTWWGQQGRAWEVFARAQRPWEQEGPLRWQRRLGSGWELHGSTLPAQQPVGRRPD
jgi:hypothetical protein